MARKKKSTGLFVGVAVFAVVALLLIFLVPQTAVTGGDGAKICSSETTPNLSVKGYDIEKNTALTEATNLYRVKGEKTWSTFTQGTAFAVSPGDTLEVVMGITTSDFTDNAYGDMFEYTVPCEETPSIEKALYADEEEGSLTATFYNNDGDASAETYTAGQTQTVSVKLEASVDEYFGNPYLTGNPNVICLALNTTVWDTPEKVSVDGVEMKAVSTPLRHSATAGKKDYCYEIPVVSDEAIFVDLKLNADDTTAPGVDDTASIYAANWFFNSDTGEIESGVENEEGTAVGTDAADTVTLDFTA